MMDSIFDAQFQSTLYNLFIKLLEKQANNTSGASGEDTGAYSTEGSADGQNGSFETIIQQACQRYNVNESLVKAVIQAESNYRPNAVSSAGAMGLMQLMPGTARGLGVDDPLDPAQNVDGGVRLLRSLLNRYDGDVSLALAAYNAGPGAVDEYGGIPPYRETQVYVQRIMGYLDHSSTWSV